MRYLVNGEPAEFGQTDCRVIRRGDRLVVTGPDGVQNTALVTRVGDTTYVSYDGHQYEIKPETGSKSTKNGGAGDGKAPMPGVIVSLLCQPGETVSKGDRMLLLEAMKMQLPIVAPLSGMLVEYCVGIGEQVEHGQQLFRIEP